MNEPAIHLIILVVLFFIGGVLGLAFEGSFGPYCWYAVLAYFGVFLIDMCN